MIQIFLQDINPLRCFEFEAQNQTQRWLTNSVGGSLAHLCSNLFFFSGFPFKKKKEKKIINIVYFVFQLPPRHSKTPPPGSVRMWM